jgi:hypothetical protein
MNKKRWLAYTINIVWILLIAAIVGVFVKQPWSMLLSMLNSVGAWLILLIYLDRNRYSNLQERN